MKRNVFSALAVLSLVAMFAAPVMADLNAFSVPGNAVRLGTQPGGRSDGPSLQFGIMNPAGTALLTANQVINANSSSNIAVTFGFVWPYATNYATFPGPSGVGGGQWAVLGARFTLFWDSVEVSPVGLFGGPPGGSPGGVGTMFPLNFSPATIIGVLQGADAGATGITGVGLFANRGGGTANGFGVTSMTVTANGSVSTMGGFGMSPIGHNGLVKFARATFHAGPAPLVPGALDVFLTGAVSGRFFTDVVTTDIFGNVNTNRVWTTAIQPGSIFIFGGGVPGGYDVVPEPASASLLGIGLFALVGGVWRRRRRRLA